jgi:hypothetical protein
MRPGGLQRTLSCARFRDKTEWMLTSLLSSEIIYCGVMKTQGPTRHRTRVVVAVAAHGVCPTFAVQATHAAPPTAIHQRTIRHFKPTHAYHGIGSTFSKTQHSGLTANVLHVRTCHATRVSRPHNQCLIHTHAPVMPRDRIARSAASGAGPLNGNRASRSAQIRHSACTRSSAPPRRCSHDTRTSGPGVSNFTCRSSRPGRTTASSSVCGLLLAAHTR